MSGSPYRAPPVELKMNFLTPASTLAFNTLRPPTTFTNASKPGSATDLGTSDCAAWWLTTSGRNAEIAAATPSLLRTSSSRICAWRLMFALLPVLRSSRMATSCPAAR